MSGQNTILRLPKSGKVATITSGSATSNAVDISSWAIFGFQLPSAFTGATVTFQVSADGSNFTTLKDQTGTTITMTVAASFAYPFPDEVSPWSYVKIVSASNEAATRSIIIAAKA